MTLTIGGQSQSSTDVPRELAPVISYKPTWSDSFEVVPELSLVQASLTVAALGAGEAVLSLRYGDLVHPWVDGDTSDFAPGAWEGGWVQIAFSDAEGEAVAWVGRVVTTSRHPAGNVGTARTGTLRLYARGPLVELARTQIRTSFWERSGASSTQEIDWVPAFNQRDNAGRVVGNRSSAVADSTSYVFGGTSTWTRQQQLDYVVARHANLGGPVWTVAGDALDALAASTDSVPLDQAENVAQAIEEIVDPKLGVSWRIEATEDGFAVVVFALQPEEVVFGSAALPANPSTVEFNVGTDFNMTAANVQVSYLRRYSRVRVVGERAVVCFSLDAAAASNALTPKWTSGQESTYKAGTGTASDEPYLHDLARGRPSLEAVFSHFGAPANVDLAALGAAPKIGPDGELVAGQSSDFQVARRSTLRWTPLRAGFDYTTNPPTENVPANHEAEYLRPLAWIQDPNTSRYVPVHMLDPGIGVASPGEDWGVVLRANPPHRVALNDWSGAADSLWYPEFDHTTLVATFAIESDERLKLEWTNPDGFDGTEIEIEVGGAAFHYLAAGTVVDVSATGGLVKTGEGRVLRNDNTRLELAMAGAIARYGKPRARAEIEMRGFHPWASLLGSILTTVEEDGAVDVVSSPITSIHWVAGKRGSKTIVRAGFAGG